MLLVQGLINALRSKVEDILHTQAFLGQLKYLFKAPKKKKKKLVGKVEIFRPQC